MNLKFDVGRGRRPRRPAKKQQICTKPCQQIHEILHICNTDFFCIHVFLIDLLDSSRRKKRLQKRSKPACRRTAVRTFCFVRTKFYHEQNFVDFLVKTKRGMLTSRSSLELSKTSAIFTSKSFGYLRKAFAWVCGLFLFGISTGGKLLRKLMFYANSVCFHKIFSLFERKKLQKRSKPACRWTTCAGFLLCAHGITPRA